MQDKLLNILLDAKNWITAREIAEIGGWRSPANVGIELQRMEKGGRVTRRKSPKVKMDNGMPATEWRHIDKQFGGDEVATLEKAIAPKVEQKAPEVKQAPPVRFVGPDYPSELNKLREQLKLAEKQRDEHFANLEDARHQLDVCKYANDNWFRLAGEFECNTIPELRIYINSALSRIGKTLPSEEAIDIKDAAVGYIVRVPKRKVRVISQPESARNAALAAARATGKAEVFALVPVGKAVRGAEWRPEVQK